VVEVDAFEKAVKPLLKKAVQEREARTGSNGFFQQGWSDRRSEDLSFVALTAPRREGQSNEGEVIQDRW
jgi:hypothetical protein